MTVDTSQYKPDILPVSPPQVSQTSVDFSKPTIIERLQKILYTEDIQGRKLSGASPLDSQALRWNKTKNTWEPQSGAYGKMSAGSVATTTGVWVKIPFNTSIISQNITCDTTNNRITVLADGIYKIDGQSSIDSLTSGNYFELRVRVNGSEISYATGRVISASSSLISYVSLSTILSLNANDYVELWGFQQTGSFNTGTVNTLSLFSI